MKQKIILITIGMLSILIIHNIFSNKTFLKNYYVHNEVTKVPIPKYSYLKSISTRNLAYPKGCCADVVELLTFNKEEYLNNFIKDYIENLQSCYDEGYFYDEKNNVTYGKYKLEKNNLTIEFQTGNYCKNELVLEDNWLDYFKKSKITSNMNYEYLISILEKSKREEHEGRLDTDFNSEYIIEYIYNSHGFIMYIQKLNGNEIGITLLDSNDAKKYAIYTIKNTDEFLSKLKEKL